MVNSISYICFTNYSGFATAARNNIIALKNSRYNISIQPLDFAFNKKYTQIHDELNSIIKPYDKNKIQIYHCIPDMCRRVKSSVFNIAYATFETFDPPKQWINILNKQQAVIVPSMFNYEIFCKHLSVPVFYIPHCIDFTKYNHNVVGDNHDKFRFLFLGTWKERKNYKNLISAFSDVFKNKDDVELVMKTSYFQSDPEKYIAGIKNIKIDSSVITDEEIPSYIKSFDCMVIPSRGEGFCIPGLQAMALGVPVIISEHSGCSEYANENTSVCLKPEGMEFIKCMDNVPQFFEKRWAIISKDQIKESLKFVINNKELCEKKSINSYDMLKNKFGYDVIVAKFNNMFKKLNINLQTD